uniref:Uncharacterized protein n=1 Tax=Solanum lycopersicum TaxID=4081 RepID=A0A3Q7HJR4_SOLLC
MWCGCCTLGLAGKAILPGLHILMTYLFALVVFRTFLTGLFPCCFTTFPFFAKSRTKTGSSCDKSSLGMEAAGLSTVSFMSGFKLRAGFDRQVYKASQSTNLSSPRVQNSSKLNQISESITQHWSQAFLPRNQLPPPKTLRKNQMPPSLFTSLSDHSKDKPTYQNTKITTPFDKIGVYILSKGQNESEQAERESLLTEYGASSSKSFAFICEGVLSPLLSTLGDAHGGRTFIYDLAIST